MFHFTQNNTVFIIFYTNSRSQLNKPPSKCSTITCVQATTPKPTILWYTPHTPQSTYHNLNLFLYSLILSLPNQTISSTKTSTLSVLFNVVYSVDTMSCIVGVQIFVEQMKEPLLALLFYESMD